MVNLRKSKATAPTKKKTDNRIFYGYIVVLTSLLILVVLHGAYASYGVFLRPIQGDFGWDRATISGATSLAFFLMGLFSTVGGRLTDRYGPKLVMVLGGLILGVGYFLVSRVSMAWQLYVAYGVVVGIGTSTGDVTLMSTAARWFVKRRGLMTSIVKVGTGAGMFIMPLVASWLIVKYDWRTAFVVLGIIAAVVIVIAAQFLKRDPSQVGLQPDGIVGGTTSTRSLKDTDLTLREALRTRQFWMVCAAYFAIWYAAQSVMVHIAVHSVDNGLSVARSASIVSGIGGMSILGRLAMGGAGDRIGNRRALVMCCAVLLTALIWLQFAQGLWMFYLFAAIYGFAHGGTAAVVSPLAAELFGIKSHGANLGMLLFLGQTGGALGPIVTGRIFDLQHSYHLAFLILIGAAAGALALAALLGPVKLRKQQVRTESSF